MAAPVLAEGLYHVVCWDADPAAEPRVWDVHGNNKTVGARVGLWAFRKELNQRFKVMRTPQGTYQLQASHSNMLVEVFNGSPVIGDALAQNNPMGGSPLPGHQHFLLLPQPPLADGRVFFQLHPMHMGADVVLDIQANGDIIQSRRETDKKSQLFYFMKAQ
eukprot:m.246279 g.246279  ORF g.246279 m.246279 type:complete len:161 (+) comp42161_c0_seq1:135-617(+)